MAQVGLAQLVQRRDDRLGHVAPPERPVAGGERLVGRCALAHAATPTPAAATAATKAATRSGSLRPGDASTPLDTSTSAGVVRRDGLADVLGASARPPGRTGGRAARPRGAPSRTRSRCRRAARATAASSRTSPAALARARAIAAAPSTRTPWITGRPLASPRPRPGRRRRGPAGGSARPAGPCRPSRRARRPRRRPTRATPSGTTASTRRGLLGADAAGLPSAKTTPMPHTPSRAHAAASSGTVRPHTLTAHAARLRPHRRPPRGRGRTSAAGTPGSWPRRPER